MTSRQFADLPGTLVVKAFVPTLGDSIMIRRDFFATRALWVLYVNGLEVFRGVDVRRVYAEANARAESLYGGTLPFPLFS